MMNKYEIIETDNLTGGINSCIIKYNDDGSVSYIPIDPANSDYQAYLAEQSTPMVTDEADSL